jgi:poly(3-hydroxybutyrate) depolymerase
MKNTILSILLFATCSVQSADSTLDLLARHLATPDAKRLPIAKQKFANASLNKADAAKARQMLWDDHSVRIRATRQAEMKAKAIKIGGHTMRFEFFVYGKKPTGGRSLYISLHGGGKAPEHVNDSQWNNQKRLYQPAEGIYVAPRAPTNTWNLWHQGHIDGLFARLIENFIVLHNVNPNRVYLMGYSAGGDGVYQLAPRMADRFAAVAMMAGHPNETSPLGLRNVAFTLHVGERDGGFNRNKVAANWKTQLAALRKADPKGYIHHVKIHAGLGHWMNRRDAVAVPWMARHTRNPLPARIVWKQDDVRHPDFYWLAVPENETGGRPQITAMIEKQLITLDGPAGKTVYVRLNDKLADLEQFVTVFANGKKIFTGNPKRTIALLAQTLSARHDPHLMFSAQIKVKLAARP